MSHPLTHPHSLFPQKLPAATGDAAVVTVTPPPLPAGASNDKRVGALRKRNVARRGEATTSGGPRSVVDGLATDAPGLILQLRFWRRLSRDNLAHLFIRSRSNDCSGAVELFSQLLQQQPQVPRPLPGLFFRTELASTSRFLSQETAIPRNSKGSTVETGQLDRARGAAAVKEVWTVFVRKFSAFHIGHVERFKLTPSIAIRISGFLCAR